MMVIIRGMGKKKLAFFLSVLGVFLIIFVNISYGLDIERPDEEEKGSKTRVEKNVKVGVVGNSDEPGKNSGENRDSYEYLQRISYYTGWKYTYVYGTKEELLDKLENGEIDILSKVFYSEKSSDKFLYGSYIAGSEKYYIYIKRTDDIETTGDFEIISGKRIGVSVGDGQKELLEYFLSKNKIEADIVEFESKAMLVEAMDNAEIDAAVLEKSDSKNEYEKLINIGALDYYYVVANGRDDLYKELNWAMNAIQSANTFFNEMLIYNYQEKNAGIDELEEIDKAWLDNNDEITIGYINDYLPFSDTDDNGKTIGVITIIIDKILENLNIADKLTVKYKGYNNFDDLRVGLNAGEIDAAFPMVSDLEFVESNGIIQTYDVVESSVGMIYKGDYSSGKIDSIAISAHSPLQIIYTKKYYNDCEIVVVDSAAECLSAVKSGKVDGTIFNMTRAQSYLSKDEFSSLHVAQCGENVKYCFYLKKESVELMSILNRGIGNLDDNFVFERMNEYVDYENTYTISDFIKEHIIESFVLFAIIITLIVVVISLFISSRKVSKNALIDGLTKVNNRKAFDKLYSTKISNNNSIAIIMCDLNGLKQVNDELGHAAGDEYIKSAANVLSNVFSKKNVYRIGGDEFTVVLTGSNEEKVKESLDKIKLECDNNSVSIAFGYAISDNPEESFEKLLKKADENMYSAKEKFYLENCRDRRKTN